LRPRWTTSNGEPLGNFSVAISGSAAPDAASSSSSRSKGKPKCLARCRHRCSVGGRWNSRVRPPTRRTTARHHAGRIEGIPRRGPCQPAGTPFGRGCMRVKTPDAGGRAQQPRHDVEGDLASVRFTKGGEHASRTICVATPMPRAAANSPQQASASGRNIIIVWCKPQWCTIFRSDLT